MEWNALTTVHAANADHPAVEVYRFLRDECGARFIQFIPIVERPSGANGVRAWRRPSGHRASGSVAARQWGRFLPASSTSGCAATWARSSCRCSTSRWRTGTASRRGSASTRRPAAAALALEHNGDVYSCDHFVEPGYLLGNIARDGPCPSWSPRRSNAASAGQARHAAAVLPRLRRALRLPRRLPQGPLHRHARRRARPQLPLRRLQGVLPPRRRARARMCELLRAGRAPAEIMAEYRGLGS